MTSHENQELHAHNSQFLIQEKQILFFFMVNYFNQEFHFSAWLNLYITRIIVSCTGHGTRFSRVQKDFAPGKS